MPDAKCASSELLAAALHLHVGIVGAGGADIDAGRRRVQAIGRQPGIFQRLPANLQQHALLRIHAVGLARRKAEELGIELVDMIAESGGRRGDLAGSLGIGIVKRLVIPAILRHGADGVALFREEAPERRGIMHAARRAASQTYDRDRRIGVGFQRIGTRLGLLQRQEGPLKRSERGVHRRPRAASSVSMSASLMRATLAAEIAMGARSTTRSGSGSRSARSTSIDRSLVASFSIVG